MSFGQKDADKEWPTFNYEDVQVSYSPNGEDGENDKIFTDFKPATEFHNIRNKKRKSKKARALRLISESEINRKNQSCCQDRKRCVVISVLITCVIIIVAICIFLGVYFGVLVKGNTSNEQSQSGSSVDIVTLSTTKVPPPPQPPLTAATTKKTTTTQPLPTKSPSTQPKTTTASTTTSSSTTSTTTTTTTTTTTSTTPVPTTTEPPVRDFTGSDDDINDVIATAKNCTNEIIFSTDSLSNDQKCSLYFEMLRCVYVLSTRNLLHVPVHILGEIMENNTRAVFPIWIEIVPHTCKENGVLDINNITKLPVKLSELCSSPDAITYFGKRDCNMVHNSAALAQESDENKCRVRWGMIGCVSRAMSCPLEEIESTINSYESNVTDILHTARQDLCNDMFDTIFQTSPCSLTLYRHMGSIYTKCSRVIQIGSQLKVQDLACPLFEVFFECSYSHIPSLMRYETCEPKKSDLRPVTFDIAQTLTKVDIRPSYFINVSPCIDTPIISNYICESPKKLVAVVDTLCYRKFNIVTRGTVCKVISEYIYECGPQYIEELGLKCTASQIKAAMISETAQLFAVYGLNMTSLANQDNCIKPA